MSGVREVHGFASGDGVWGGLAELAGHIRVSLHGQTARDITPDHARYLATKLRRLARRVDERARAKSNQGEG